VVAGELPSYKVYEDDWVLCTLDINPVGRGHTLVIPKQHFEDVLDIEEDLMLHVYRVAKKVAEAQKKALNPAGIGIAQNSGSAAGQIIFHFHTHVIPKESVNQNRYEPSPEELTEVAGLIRKNMVI
jgi:histidine triad (HIT) family protein